MTDHEFDLRREAMVREQLERRGIRDERVLRAFRKVPRHRFVKPALQDEAYEDRPIPIGPDQTVSQPYVVAFMLQELGLNSKDRVLEIGTGSGYQTALLAELADQVFSVELDPELLSKADILLKNLGYKNIALRCGDGWYGWEEVSPFEKIVLSAAPASVPRDLIRQLKVGGSIILPLGDLDQMLVLFTKTTDGLQSREISAVRFVELKRSRGREN